MADPTIPGPPTQVTGNIFEGTAFCNFAYLSGPQNVVRWFQAQPLERRQAVLANLQVISMFAGHLAEDLERQQLIVLPH